MGWFKRIKKGVTTETNQKKEIPEGLVQMPKCKTIITSEEHHQQYYVCNNCNHHHRINAKEYFEILFDKNKFTELDPNMKSKDPLEFEDRKKYTERLESIQKKPDFKDVVTTAYGKINKKDAVIACFNFNFIGGSMGSVVGEKIATRAIEYARKTKTPLIIISKSGGARMMEASFSLMQLAKTSAKLAQLGEEGIPYFSVLTDPTTGGITASFAMLGDLNIGEPNALIGFAGPRVVKETIGKDLPEGFQTTEFVKEHGFLDLIVDRKNLKEKLSQLIRIYSS